MHARRWIAVVVVGGAAFVQTPVWAGEPATRNSVQLGLGLRYGIGMNDPDFNPWGVGLGLDGGYTLPNAIYVGGTFDYFFGDSRDRPGIKLTGNVWQLMAEGGYDIGLGDRVVIRPKLGAGLGTLRAELCVDGSGCASDSSTKFALAPGATFMLFAPHFRLSVDVRYSMVFNDSATTDPVGLDARGTFNAGAKALILSAGVGF